jgi:Fic family protein
LTRTISRLHFELSDTALQAATDAEKAVMALDRLEGASASDFAAAAYRQAALNIDSFASAKLNGRQPSIAALLRDEALARFAGEPAASNASGGSGLSQYPSGDADNAMSTLRASEAMLLALSEGARVTSSSGDAKRSVRADVFALINGRLLEGTNRATYKSRLRSDEQRVGGNRFHSILNTASMPQPQEIPVLLRDLAHFCSASSLPAVAQTALAYLQFISIHPFKRANGKTAMAVIPLLLSRRGVINSIIPPVSLAFALYSHEYSAHIIGALEVMRKIEELVPLSILPTSVNAKLSVYVEFFASCCTLAATEALSFLQDVNALQREWAAARQTRSDATIGALIWSLPATPVITCNAASAYLGRSFKRVTVAVEELVDTGVLRQVSRGRRNRVFDCPAILQRYAEIAGFQ